MNDGTGRPQTYQPAHLRRRSGIRIRPFLSEAPLTPQEWLQVPGDVVRALIGGVTDEIKKIFGITPPPVSSVPASVSASLTGSPAAQAISPAASLQSQDPVAEKVATRTAPVRDTLTKGTRAHRAAAVPATAAEGPGAGSCSLRFPEDRQSGNIGQ